jgi:hypothetical protein
MELPAAMTSTWEISLRSLKPFKELVLAFHAVAYSQIDEKKDGKAPLFFAWG